MRCIYTVCLFACRDKFWWRPVPIGDFRQKRRMHVSMRFNSLQQGYVKTEDVVGSPNLVGSISADSYAVISMADAGGMGSVCCAGQIDLDCIGAFTLLNPSLVE